MCMKLWKNNYPLLIFKKEEWLIPLENEMLMSTDSPSGVIAKIQSKRFAAGHWTQFDERNY